MPRKIIHLLNDYSIRCNLPNNDPILQLPLSLFNTNEYADLITIVWLYEHKWFNPLKIPSPHQRIGEVSYQQARGYYNAISDSVVSLMQSNNPNPSYSRTITPPPPPKWLNPSQMTFLLSTTETFSKLYTHLDCSEELNIFFSWLKNGKLNYQEQRTLEKRLTIKGLRNTLDATTCSMAIELLKTKTLQQSADSLAYAKELENTFKHGHSGLTKENARFFSKVMSIVIEKFPTPLGTMLQGLGIHIPEDISPELKLILDKNIEDVPGLQMEEWFPFLFYLILFVHQFAQASPSLLAYTFSGTAESLSFERYTKAHSKKMTIILNNDEQSTAPIYPPDVKDQIQRELKEFHLSSVHPKLIALFCFDQCKPLQTLFAETWKQLAIPLTKIEPITITSTRNPFALGEAVYDPDNKKIIPLSKAEIRLVSKLKEIVRSLEASTSGTSGPFFSVISLYTNITSYHIIHG